MSTQRIRDPLHDLIEFSNSQLERTLWETIKTRPFQRLRRVKQLGFSELVFPGASHSRLAHSIGVFHTARQLMKVVEKYTNENRDNAREERALAAALLHDVGHGPFSHSFEKVGERLGLKYANHEVLSGILIREGEIASVLNSIGSGFANDVADIIEKGGVKSVHHAVVSSQFDADRLDYMRRDRLMSGTQHAAIDFTWLVGNLEVARVSTGVDETQIGAVETFVIGPKAIHAAEAFVLGLFHLYPTVYLHKTTRGAEKLFTELLVRVITLIRDGSVKSTGLTERHPLAKFALDSENVENALLLDDAVIWGALSQMEEATDGLLRNFSTRIRDRKLYKCHDVRIKVAHAIDPRGENSDELNQRIDKCCASIKVDLNSWSTKKAGDCPRILVDDTVRSPYGPSGESKGPLDRINVKTASGTLCDLSERSSVVASLKTYKIVRAYVAGDDSEALKAVDKIVDGEITKCTAKSRKKLPK
jgi:uncharacterized protein